MLELKFSQSLNDKKSGNQFYASSIFVRNALLRSLIFFLPAETLLF